MTTPRIGNVVTDSNGTYGRIGYIYHDENGAATLYDVTFDDGTNTRLKLNDFTVVWEGQANYLSGTK